MSPEEREKKRQVMIAYNLRKKAGLTKSQEQAERESMEILRANQANDASLTKTLTTRRRNGRSKRRRGTPLKSILTPSTPSTAPASGTVSKS